MKKQFSNIKSPDSRELHFLKTENLKVFKFKHLFLFLVFVAVSHTVFSQCNMGTETVATFPAVTCSDQNKLIGSGAKATVTLTNGLYYTFSFSAGSANANNICINGATQSTSFNYACTSTASYTIGTNRSGAWNTNSATITYRLATPAATNTSTANICIGQSTTLAGNDAVTAKVGTGAWTVTSGPNTSTAQFASTTTYNTTFTPTLAGSYVVRWTVSNSTCTAASADATITVNALPTTQATSFTASAITATTMSLAWTRGNGSNVLIIAKATSAPTDPTNGSSYTGNANYTSGTAVGGGYAVYNGAGTAVNLTGLTAGITYHFAAYEYNATGCYFLTELTGNFCTQPATPGPITGTVSQCPGATGQTYSISAVTGATSYTWVVPTGWSVTGGAGTASITATAGTAGQNGNITVTASNACASASAAQTLGVSVSAPPTPATITGTTTVQVCNTTALAIAVPSGGTESTSGGFRIHKFTGDGTFTVPTGFSGNVEVLLVGGGGSGGPAIGGGGGGGGVVHIPSVSVTAGTYNMVVGVGGVSTSANGNASVASTASTGFGATAAAGGTSGRHDAANGTAGGSGGGAGSNNGVLNVGGAASGSALGGNTGNIFGNVGGNMTEARTGSPTRAAGGGGAGAAALNTNSNSMGTGHGAGGAGIGNAILGTLYYWGGGGGGGSYYNTNSGAGGIGGGGGGGESDPGGAAGAGGASALNSGSAGNVGGDVAGGAGGANTGGGGGGGTWSNGLGGAGGSGIVVISYPVMTTGVWSSDNTAVATVNSSTGVVTGVTVGTANITYTVTKGTCTSTKTVAVTVTAPTQATTFTYTSITSTTMTLGWTRGAGTGGVLIVAKAGSAPTDPTSGSNYAANAAYGSGAAVGGGFAIYKGTGTSVALTNLVVGTTYYFAAYEFNTGDCYNLTELTGSSCPIPGQPSLMNSD